MARSNQLFTFNMNIIYPKETSESIKYLPEFKCIFANIQTVCPVTQEVEKLQAVKFGNMVW